MRLSGKLLHKTHAVGTSLAVQWLRLHASTAGGVGSIPGRGTKMPHAKKNAFSKIPQGYQKKGQLQGQLRTS